MRDDDLRIMKVNLTPDAIQHNLATAVVGRVVECYAQADSTNDIVRQRARAGPAEGLLVLADEQSAGGWAAAGLRPLAAAC